MKPRFETLKRQPRHKWFGTDYLDTDMGWFGPQGDSVGQGVEKDGVEVTRPRLIELLADRVIHTDNVVYEELLKLALSWVSDEALFAVVKSRAPELLKGPPCPTTT